MKTVEESLIIGRFLREMTKSFTEMGCKIKSFYYDNESESVSFFTMQTGDRTIDIKKLSVEESIVKITNFLLGLAREI